MDRVTQVLKFDNIVFAGGGNRCFWQAGFWYAVAPVLKLQPRSVAAVSAGAAMACAIFGGTFEHGFSGYKQAVARNARNLYVRNLLKSQPVFPHGAMYRAAILDSIDTLALSRLHQGPEITILAARPPRWASERMAILLGAISASVDAMNRNSVQAAAGRHLGFKPLCVSVRECTSPQELADLILASSCVPPFTPQIRRAGAALLDGGLVSSVPTEFPRATDASTLVLLTRRFSKLPSVPGHTYVQPSAPTPVGTWDYTNHTALQATFDLGQRDGAAFCDSLGATDKARSGLVEFQARQPAVA
ncbi:MAG: patatin-like phospholipase family protein [Burkholderiales bacterium]|nr:patatin-like phospholipase family protein [Burkholderiales bacterium]